MALKLAQGKTKFREGFGNIATNFAFIKDKEIQEKILELAEKNSELLQYHGSAYKKWIEGLMLESAPSFYLETLQTKSQHLLNTKLGENFGFIKDELLRRRMIKWAFEMIEKNKELASSLGLGLGEKFWLLQDDIQEKILEIAEKNSEFAYGVGLNIGENISSIVDKKKQEKIWDLVEKNSEFAYGFFDHVGVSFPSVKDKKLQDKILR